MRRAAVIAYHSSPLLEPGAGDAGGMTVYIRDVARVMAKLGVRTDVFTRSAIDSVEITDVFPGVRVVAIPAGPAGPLQKSELTAYIDDFVRGIRAFATTTRARYDVIHSHYWQSGLAGAGLSGTWGVPLVHSSHTLAKVKNRFRPPGDTPEPAARLAGEATAIGAADILIASTDEEFQHLACLYSAPHDRLKTVYPGVDHALFAPGSKAESRRRLGLGQGVVLAYVGRIQPLKGLDLAIRALEQLVPALDQEIELVIVGGTSGEVGEHERTSLEDLARSLGIAEHVRFEGPRAHHDTPLYYRAADAVVVCSYSESFGLSALEAQACGTPVVGTDVGGLRHIVADGASGYLLESREPSQFAARLKTMLADRDLHRAFSERALASATRFTWEQTAAELFELYECLTTEHLPEACTC